MTLHVIGRVVGQSSGSDERSEGVREAVGTVVCPTAVFDGGRVLLEATRVSCRQSGAVQSAARCITCDRFVNYCPSSDRSHVTIRCRWNAEDRVESLMRKADSLLVVPRDSTLDEVIPLAHSYDQRHVLVVEDGMLVGIVDVGDADFEDRPGTVSQVMSRRMWVTFPDSTLSDARRIMLDNGCEALPVIDDTRLCGVLLWDDIIEVGLA